MQKKGKKKQEYVGMKRQKPNSRQILNFEEINQKILAKEGRLKRYQDRLKQYNQNRTFKNNKIKFQSITEKKYRIGKYIDSGFKKKKSS